MKWEVCVNALPRKCLWLSWNDSPASTSSPVTYPCNLTKSLWSHRPRKKKWKKLDGKRLIFHLTQYLQQNWWYHKEMLVCINQKKFRNAKLGTWKGVLELNWHWMLGTWRPQRGIVSGCLVFCHFFVNKFVIRNCRCRRGDKYQVRILGTWKVRTVRWQRHLFVCRFSLILVYNLGSKHLVSTFWSQYFQLL